MTPKKFLYLKLALDRQVHDSIRIEELAEKEEECLNLRSERRGHKLLEILVMRPKGTRARIKEGGEVKGNRRQLREGHSGWRTRRRPK